MRLLESITRILAPIGIGAMIVMMTTVTFSVLGRALFSAPIYGSVEVVELTGAILVSFVVAYTQLRRRNIAVNIVVDRMSPRLRGAFDSVTLILSLAIMVVILWTGAIYAWETAVWGETTYVYEITTLPFRIIWLLGCTILCIVFIAQIIESLAKVVKKWNP